MKKSTFHPNSTATTEDFEFAALSEAYYYPRAIVREFKPYLAGHIIEVGAGIGQMSKLFGETVGNKNITALEPDPVFARKFREYCPNINLIEGTVSSLSEGTPCGSIVSVNVIEHIEDHVEELMRYRKLLAPQKGYLCIFAPARPELYSALDKDFGHFRRYTKHSMQEALRAAGFVTQEVCYFNFIGYFAWLVNFKLLKSRSFNPQMVKFYDRVIFRVSHLLENRFMRPPVGQSILAIAQA